MMICRCEVEEGRYTEVTEADAEATEKRERESSV
jgi:hypothetical protein